MHTHVASILLTVGSLDVARVESPVASADDGVGAEAL